MKLHSNFIRTAIVFAVTALLFFSIGRLSPTRIKSGKIGRTGRNIIAQAGNLANLDDRSLVLAEHPEIIPALTEGAKFGGEDLSTLTAQNIFSLSPDVTEEIRKKTHVHEVTGGVWHIRFPIVNCALFETGEGFVLVDSGMAAAGPVLRDIIKDLGDKPLIAVIYTHYHVDHAYGTWALVQEWNGIQVISHESTAGHFDRYDRFPGNIARLMSQPEDQITEAVDRLVYPTLTFADEMIFNAGGTEFHIVNAPGETEDQSYVWIPERSVLCAADYHQGFLPNAGNGKRVQRFVEEWASALDDMAALNPAFMLPGHGAAMNDPEKIVRELSLLSSALESIVQQVEDGLNSGFRAEEAAARVKLPAHLAEEPSLRTVYTTPQDIARMAARRYTGWWDGIPSHYNPPGYDETGAELIRMAGGLPAYIEEVYQIAETNIAAACVLADYAWLTYPENTEVQHLAMDVYGRRISSEAETTQEILAYLDHLTEVRGALRQNNSE